MTTEIAGPLYRDMWRHIQPDSARRLLLAALHSFAERGYEATTTRQIAGRAGLGIAGVYMHYRSKADLLFEIIKTGHERVLDEVGRTLGEGPAEERLRDYVSVFVLWHARFHTLARVCQYELVALSGDQAREIGVLRRSFQRQVEDILRSGCEEAAFTVPDVRGTGRAILSLGIDVARWYEDDGPLRPDDLAGLYSDLAARMVTPRARASRPRT